MKCKKPFTLYYVYILEPFFVDLLICPWYTSFALSSHVIIPRTFGRLLDQEEFMSKTSYKPFPQTIPQSQVRPWYRDLALWVGALGVLAFSFTFPAIHIAEPVFGDIIAGPGRALLTTPLAIVLLIGRAHV